MKATAIVQARIGSKRLPGKVLKPILGRPMLWHILQRLSAASRLKNTVVATSGEEGDAAIRQFCREFGYPVFCGSEHDVLDRFYRAAVQFEADPVVRVTADCPFVDPQVVDSVLALQQIGGYDHVGVAAGAGALLLPRGRYPRGLDAECFGFSCLERAWREATDSTDREHVTPFMWRNPSSFRLGRLLSNKDYPHLRWTVDNPADFQLVRKVYEALYQRDRTFLMDDILNYLSRHPELVLINQKFIGREGDDEIWNAGSQNHSMVKESRDPDAAVGSTRF